MSKSLRRHHEKRIKQKVRKYLSASWNDSPRYLGMLARSKQLCSCPGCGNPKEWEGDKVKYKALNQRRYQEGIGAAIDETWDGISYHEQDLGY